MGAGSYHLLVNPLSSLSRLARQPNPVLFVSCECPFAVGLSYHLVSNQIVGLAWGSDPGTPQMQTAVNFPNISFHSLGSTKKERLVFSPRILIVF